MKKLVLLFLISVGNTALFGQINYYQGKDTLHIGNEIYKITFYKHFDFTISNINNTKTDQVYYLDGSPVPVGQVSYKIENNGDNTGLWRAARETFAPEEIAALYNERVSIGYYVTPDGTVFDLEFTIPQKEVFYSIPPERWATLDKKIKEYVKFQLSGAEKYQYVVPGSGAGLQFKNVYNE